MRHPIEDIELKDGSYLIAKSFKEEPKVLYKFIVKGEEIIKPKINIIKKETLTSEVKEEKLVIRSKLNIIKEELVVSEDEILDEIDTGEVIFRGKGSEFTEDELLNEEWRSLDFHGYPNYSVSDLGRVKNIKKNVILMGIFKQDIEVLVYSKILKTRIIKFID